MTHAQDVRTHSRLGNGLFWFSGAVLVIGSIVKFLHPAKAAAYMAFFGYENEKMLLVACVELAVSLLFLIRSTRAVGLLLVSAYLGGAIAVHVASHTLTSTNPIIVFDYTHPYLGCLPPAIVLVSAWVGTWLRQPELLPRLAGARGDARVGSAAASLTVA